MARRSKAGIRFLARVFFAGRGVDAFGIRRCRKADYMRQSLVDGGLCRRVSVDMGRTRVLIGEGLTLVASSSVPLQVAVERVRTDVVVD